MRYKHPCEQVNQGERVPSSSVDGTALRFVIRMRLFALDGAEIAALNSLWRGSGLAVDGDGGAADDGRLVAA